jgi:anti-anti-sigma regulatory factor
MILVTSNKEKEILLFSFIGRVRRKELADSHDSTLRLLSELSEGYRLITDLSAVEVIDPDCVHEISRTMQACDEKGVGLLVRVIPDPSKDIGFKILSAFHYAHAPHTVTCETMVEAAKALEL